MGMDLKAMNDEGDGFGKAEREPEMRLTMHKTVVLTGEYVEAEIEDGLTHLRVTEIGSMSALAAAEEICTIIDELRELEAELRKR